jgi:hypothetical protein
MSMSVFYFIPCIEILYSVIDKKMLNSTSIALFIHQTSNAQGHYVLPTVASLIVHIIRTTVLSFVWMIVINKKVS